MREIEATKKSKKKAPRKKVRKHRKKQTAKAKNEGKNQYPMKFSKALEKHRTRNNVNIVNQMPPEQLLPLKQLKYLISTKLSESKRFFC